ncbi:hypothetical protein BSF41_34740 [Flavobacterium sp. ACN2]|nr:hypothetical protein BSF41_34740 [Flavobacterium sp. ACN2]
MVRFILKNKTSNACFQIFKIKSRKEIKLYGFCFSLIIYISLKIKSATTSIA